MPAVLHATAPPTGHANVLVYFVGLEFSGGDGTNYARKFDSAPGAYASRGYRVSLR